MRTISAEQRRLIDDAIGELSLALSPAILEKDILVTEVLRAISQIALPGLTLTFSGGTCLAKAYQLLERMSEDIDLRLVIDNQDSLSRSALRRTLSELRCRAVRKSDHWFFSRSDRDSPANLPLDLARRQHRIRDIPIVQNVQVRQ